MALPTRLTQCSAFIIQERSPPIIKILSGRAAGVGEGQPHIARVAPVAALLERVRERELEHAAWWRVSEAGERKSKHVTS